MPLRRNLDDAWIVESYLNGMSARKIALEIGDGARTKLITNRLKRLGVSLRSQSAACRRCELNEHYFDCIDTEQKAYWLGFLLADGCVDARMNSLRVNLQGRDRAHLESLRSDLGSTYSIGFNPSQGLTGMCSFNATSKTMASRLGDLGIIANDKRCIPPANQALRRHFWRGVVDGDGTIGIRLGITGAAIAHIGICGTRETVEGFSRMANSVCGTNAKVTPRGKICIFMVHGTRAFILATHLYSECSRCLSRKYQTWLEMRRTMGDKKTRNNGETAARYKSVA